MKKKFSFYTLMGGDIGNTIGIVLENIPAGLSRAWEKVWYIDAEGSSFLINRREIQESYAENTEIFTNPLCVLCVSFPGFTLRFNF